MTMALCFNCGYTKFGAICPCPECSTTSTGDMNLDIAFSDHHFSVATLEAFGEVVRAIRRACADDQLRFWSFIRFVSVHHSDILGVQMPPERAAECDAVLARAEPPPVTVEESERARFMREYQERTGQDAEPGAAADGGGV
jgi:hypothetical protein